MAKKAEIQPSDCVLTLPCAFCHDVMSLIASCVIYRPVFTAFLCSSVTFAYFMANVPKMQHYVVSFPYEKYISKIINHKMITMYAALLEIVVELLMAVVLAGVSLTVTLWLLFEEVAERKSTRPFIIVMYSY
ncbi:hypothetical protein RUM43_004204 [Polyplax serrata]|uniref:Uncharacterized protein n=1 Tax=Polyplax serrata TaxID=468196 RepID=A0AAN8XPH1_POLSC